MEGIWKTHEVEVGAHHALDHYGDGHHPCQTVPSACRAEADHVGVGHTEADRVEVDHAEVDHDAHHDADTVVDKGHVRSDQDGTSPSVVLCLRQVVPATPAQNATLVVEVR